MKTGNKGPRKRSTGTRKTVRRVTKGHAKAPTIEIRDGMVYTVDQLAALLQVSTKTARAIVKRQEIPARKVGQQWRILGDDVREYMRSFRPLTAAESLSQIPDAYGLTDATSGEPPPGVAALIDVSEKLTNGTTDNTTGRDDGNDKRNNGRDT
jgi:excisionase family DNA binding protein